VLKARDLLEGIGVAADIWSVTSYNELSREGLETERRNLFAGNETEQPYVRRLLAEEQGVFVAASDYMKALPLSIARWVPGPYVVLGTDGYGLSESRPDLRAWFEVSAEYIAHAALASLAEIGRVSPDELAQAAETFGIDRDKPNASSAGPAEYSG
jgi:pyruvate dehydrogenase E1 component